jgi:hypothetical protein
MVLAFTVLALGSTPVLIAQYTAFGAHHTYSVKSLQGDYAAVNHYGDGGNLALGIGTEQFDGSGNCQGTLLLNRPTSTGTRELVPLTSTGTYTVNPDGTGIIYLTVTLPDGTTRTGTEDFVITRTERIRGSLIATEVLDEQREPSLVLGNGVFVTQDFTRRGDEQQD